MRISREWLHAPATTASPSRGGTRLWSRRAFLVATRHWCWTIPTPDRSARRRRRGSTPRGPRHAARGPSGMARSEEHTSELQSRGHLVCRLLLEKKKKTTNKIQTKQQHENKHKTQHHTNN